jgi:hypothetical protein
MARGSRERERERFKRERERERFKRERERERERGSRERERESRPGDEPFAPWKDSVCLKRERSSDGSTRGRVITFIGRQAWGSCPLVSEASREAELEKILDRL